MLNDEHFKIVKYFPDSKDVFPTVDIKGGVCVGLHIDSQTFTPIRTFVPEKELENITNKFVKDESNNLSSIIYGGRSDLKFNDEFLTAYPNSVGDRIKFIQIKHPNVSSLSPNEEYELKSSTFEALPYVFKDAMPKDNCDYYKLLGLVNLKREYKWIEKKYMNPRYPSNNNIDKYKVFVPESNGAGKFGEALSNPVIGSPNDSATPTFISIGSFDTFVEANNALKYIKTKLARTLLSICKKTQHNPSGSWAYIPLQDFTNDSDIDWDKSIEEIDKQLYKKYNLSEEEINFIESNVQAMK